MRMKNIFLAFLLCAVTVSCTNAGISDQTEQKLSVYRGNGFAITYPEGYTVNPKFSGVVIGGDITINVKSEYLPGCKKGVFPKNSYTLAKAGLEEAQFEKTRVDGKTAFLNMTDVLAIQLLPLNDLVIAVMCSPGAEVTDFKASASKIVGSLVVSDEKKLVSTARLEQEDDKNLQEELSPKDVFEKRTEVDKKDLANFQFFENNDLFFRLPYGYFVKDMGTETVIKGFGKKVGTFETITISLFEKSSLPFEKFVIQSMGKIPTADFEAGTQKYIRFDAEDSVDGKYTILYARSKRNDIRITVKGPMGLTAQNLELLKSIVYR